MDDKITVREFLIIVKQAYKESEGFSYMSSFISFITFIGLFIDFKFSIMAFLFSILLNLFSILIGIKNLQIKILDGTLPEEYLDELFNNK